LLAGIKGAIVLLIEMPSGQLTASKKNHSSPPKNKKDVENLRPLKKGKWIVSSSLINRCTLKKCFGFSFESTAASAGWKIQMKPIDAFREDRTSISPQAFFPSPDLVRKQGEKRERNLFF
jgi:hypothetical protein